MRLHADAADAYARFAPDRQRTLLGPEDDMWATFADRAAPYAVEVDGRVVGRFSLDDERQMHGFHLVGVPRARAADLLNRAVAEIDAAALVVSTVDPVFEALAAGVGTAEPVALMYEHLAESEVEGRIGVRVAGPEDHAAAVAFDSATTGSPTSFAGPYLAERIERGELHLVEDGVSIVATGEVRVDGRAPGNAHLGLIVGLERRGRGLGGALMQTLTQVSLGRGLTPRCSTTPENLPAQAVIARAGYRSRHRVLRVATPDRTAQ